MISKRGDFCFKAVGYEAGCLQGVHLSQVHQHNKKCTNALLGAYCFIGALETSAPLNNPYNKSVCEKILHICQFCRNSQIIRTIKAGR